MRNQEEKKSMIKTTRKICSKCKYSIKLSHAKVMCDYLSKTKKLRNCNVGECDKFEKEERNYH